MGKELFKKILETLREELIKINDMDENLYVFSSNKTEKYILSLLGHIERYFEFFENNNLGNDIKLKIDSNNLQKYSGNFVVAINNLFSEIKNLTDDEFQAKIGNKNVGAKEIKKEGRKSFFEFLKENKKDFIFWFLGIIGTIIASIILYKFGIN